MRLLLLLKSQLGLFTTTPASSDDTRSSSPRGAARRTRAAPDAPQSDLFGARLPSPPEPDPLPATTTATTPEPEPAISPTPDGDGTATTTATTPGRTLADLSPAHAIEERQTSLQHARRILARSDATAAELDAALRHLPRGGKKSDDLRPRLQARLDTAGGPVADDTPVPAGHPQADASVPTPAPPPRRTDPTPAPDLPPALEESAPPTPAPDGGRLPPPPPRRPKAGERPPDQEPYQMSHAAYLRHRGADGRVTTKKGRSDWVAAHHGHSWLVKHAKDAGTVVAPEILSRAGEDAHPSTVGKRPARYSVKTPGTTLRWSNLGEWLDVHDRIADRGADQMAVHLEALYHNPRLLDGATPEQLAQARNQIDKAVLAGENFYNTSLGTVRAQGLHDLLDRAERGEDMNPPVPPLAPRERDAVPIPGHNGAHSILQEKRRFGGVEVEPHYWFPDGKGTRPARELPADHPVLPGNRADAIFGKDGLWNAARVEAVENGHTDVYLDNGDLDEFERTNHGHLERTIGREGIAKLRAAGLAVRFPGGSHRYAALKDWMHPGNEVGTAPLDWSLMLDGTETPASFVTGSAGSWFVNHPGGGSVHYKTKAEALAQAATMVASHAPGGDRETYALRHHPKKRSDVERVFVARALGMKRGDQVQAGPPGQGWEPIPRSRKGGYRRRLPSRSPNGRNYAYWYPGQGVQAHPHPEDEATDAELPPPPSAPEPEPEPEPTPEPEEVEDKAEDEPTDGRLPLPPGGADPATKRASSGGRRGKGGDPSKEGRLEHGDWGAYVAGDRKEQFRSVHAGNLAAVEAEGEIAAHKTVSKDKVLGKLDVALERSRGATAGAVYLKKQLLQHVAARPAASPAARLAYVEGAATLQKALDACTTVADVRALMARLTAAARGNDLGDPMTGAEVVRHLGLDPATIQPLSGVNYYGWTAIDLQGTGGEGGHALPLSALKAAGYTDLVRVPGSGENGRPTRYQLSRKNPEGTAGLTRLVQALGGSEPTGRFAWGDRKARFWRAINLDGSFRRQVRTAQEVEDRKAWSEVDPALAGDATAHPTKKAGKTKQRKSLENLRLREALRVGGRALPAEVLTEEHLGKGFNLRAVRYGTGGWVSDKGAQSHLRNAYGALADLADVLGIEPTQVSHGGLLALAFGARGNGQAGAHYEQGRQIINLTHTQGAGSLGHEWGHFLDHVLTGTIDADGKVATILDGDKVRGHFLSQSEGGAAVPPEVKAAAKAVMDAIKKSPGKTLPFTEEQMAAHQARAERIAAAHTLNRSRKLSSEEIAAVNQEVAEHNAMARQINAARAGKTQFLRHAEALGSYWSENHELFARAFEVFLEDELNARGRRNTYLVSGTTVPVGWMATGKSGRYASSAVEAEPYPHGEERERITSAMRVFMDAVGRTSALHKALARLDG